MSTKKLLNEALVSKEKYRARYSSTTVAFKRFSLTSFDHVMRVKKLMHANFTQLAGVGEPRLMSHPLKKHDRISLAL